MIDLYDVSVISSVTIDSADRLRNTALMLKYFETFCCNYEIIIVEHDRQSRLQELTSGRNGVFLRFVESSNPHSRAKNLHDAAVLSERKHILIWDVDNFIPPPGLEKALSMVRNGADFILPYNGVGVQVRKGAFDENIDLRDFMGRLPFFSKLHEIRPPEFDPVVFEHMCGSALSDTVGGIMLCNRRQFFLSGAMNPNMFSYGCEEGDFWHRIRKLEYKVERIEDCNAFHWEHVRTTDSIKNNFFASNRAEFSRIQAMTKAELRQYVNDGFKEVDLDTTCDLVVMNTPREYSIKVVQPDRTQLPNRCIVLVFENGLKEDVRLVEEFFDHMEANFDGYSIFVVEAEFARFRLCHSRKYARHIWHRNPLEHVSDDAIKKMIDTNCSEIEVYRFAGRFDPSHVIDRYSPVNH